jgi:hypothetical protein
LVVATCFRRFLSGEWAWSGRAAPADDEDRSAAGAARFKMDDASDARTGSADARAAAAAVVEVLPASWSPDSPLFVAGRAREVI